MIILTLWIFGTGLLGQVNSQTALEDPNCPCKDVQPPGEYDCQQQKKFKKCTAEWLITSDFCAITCGRCVCTAEPDGGPDSFPGGFLIDDDVEQTEVSIQKERQCQCTDIPPPNPWEYTCAQQKDFGKCEEDFMFQKNYCQITCDRCPCSEKQIQALYQPQEESVSNEVKNDSSLSSTETQLVALMDMLQQSTILVDAVKEPVQPTQPQSPPQEQVSDNLLDTLARASNLLSTSPPEVEDTQQSTSVEDVLRIENTQDEILLLNTVQAPEKPIVTEISALEDPTAPIPVQSISSSDEGPILVDPTAPVLPQPVQNRQSTRQSPALPPVALIPKEEAVTNSAQTVLAERVPEEKSNTIASLATKNNASTSELLLPMIGYELPVLAASQQLEPKDEVATPLPRGNYVRGIMETEPVTSLGQDLLSQMLADAGDGEQEEIVPSPEDELNFVKLLSGISNSNKKQLVEQNEIPSPEEEAFALPSQLASAQPQSAGNVLGPILSMAIPQTSSPSLAAQPAPEVASSVGSDIQGGVLPVLDLPVIPTVLEPVLEQENVAVFPPLSEVQVVNSPSVGLAGEGEIRSSWCFFSALKNVADLSLLMTVIDRAGPSFGQLLVPQGEVVTFLAPANEGFTKLMFNYDITFEELMEATPEVLMGLFSYHFVEGDVSKEDMLDMGALMSKLGQRVFVETGTSDSVRLSGYLGEEAEVLSFDLRACGITVHVIDTLLMPNGMEATLKGSAASSPSTPIVNKEAVQACRNVTLIDLLSQFGEQMSASLFQLEQSGADKLLLGDTPFTMFVPTNEVFLTTLNELIAMKSPLIPSPDSDPEENLMLYHIIQGEKILFDELFEKSSLETMYSGAELSIKGVGSQLILEGIGSEAHVVESDLGDGCNVVIHMISSVLLPQIPGASETESDDITFDQIAPYLPDNVLPSPTQIQKQPTPDLSLESCKTIGEVIESVTDLSIMGLSMIDAGYGELMSDIQKEITILAPTNEAFGNLMRDLGIPLDGIKKDPVLAKLYNDSLAMHILQQSIRFEDLVQPMEVNSLANNSKGFPEIISFRPVFPSTVKVISPQSEGNIVGSALRACKSYIYPIDTFLLASALLPPSPMPAAIQQAQSSDPVDLVRQPLGSVSDQVEVNVNDGECLTVEQVILTDPRMASFQLLLSRAGLLDIIGSSTNVTVFAPKNDGMSVVLKFLYDDVVHLSGDTLQIWSGYHIVQGIWSQKSLTKGTMLNTLAGGSNGSLQLEVDISPGKGSGKVVNIKGLSNDASIEEADIPACDAILHIIDGPLLPVQKSTLQG